MRTPGECAKRDDSEVVCRAVITSDLVVLASPLIMGFTSALLKRGIDQFIPLIHPYIEITRRIWARMARNSKSELVFVAGADRSAEEVADELASVA